jgi:hypothetical protein
MRRRSLQLEPACLSRISGTAERTRRVCGSQPRSAPLARESTRQGIVPAQSVERATVAAESGQQQKRQVVVAADLPVLAGKALGDLARRSPKRLAGTTRALEPDHRGCGQALERVHGQSLHFLARALGQAARYAAPDQEAVSITTHREPWRRWHGGGRSGSAARPSGTSPRGHGRSCPLHVAARQPKPEFGPRGQPSTSSVQTLKLVSVFGPKVVLIATSAASRPRAIITRPMRGTLWRASKVCQWPPR